MTKIYRVLLITMLAYTILPGVGFASAVKSFSGTVTGISGSQIMFSTTSAANYSADIGHAALVRKNGAVIQLTDVIVGDKISVKGTLWADNSISASYIQDNSLYAHTGTFSGKISSINPSGSSFVMQSKTYGKQTIQTNNFTSFTQNGANAGFNSLGLGMTASVKGVWDRSNTSVVAAKVDGSFRMIDIYFTGTLSIINGSGLTIIGNGNVIYGVDASKAIVQNKSGQPIMLNQFKIGDSLRVWGKHISGGVQIVGVKVKDSSTSK